MDLFTVEAVDMVSLTKVKVEYEGDGQGKGWFLEKVIVKDSANAEFQYVFNCDRYVLQITTIPASLLRQSNYHFIIYIKLNVYLSLVQSTKNEYNNFSNDFIKQINVCKWSILFFLQN